MFSKQFGLLQNAEAKGAKNATAREGGEKHAKRLGSPAVRIGGRRRKHGLSCLNLCAR